MPAGLVPLLGAFVLLFYLLLATALGILSTLITVPVFWRTRFGFVPWKFVDTTGSFGEETFLVFVHLVVGTVFYDVAFVVWALSVNLGYGLWESSAAFVIVTASAWIVFVAWPILRTHEPPDHWVPTSLLSFVSYSLAFLGGSVGIVHLLFG